MEKTTNLEVLTTIINALKVLDIEGQKRTLQAVITFLDIPIANQVMFSAERTQNTTEDIRDRKAAVSFSDNRTISPKEFLRDKSPVTDIERVTCLAYYLTHYRESPHFKTLDLSTLNTEAAQPKLSNPTVAVDNATKAGLLVQAGRGNKQISAAGEIFVQALPDREAAKAGVANLRPKKRSKKGPIKNSRSNRK